MSMLFSMKRIEIFIRMIEKLSLIRPGCYNIVMQVKGVLNMPENLQLVIITGMSGAGKQSLFKALKTWAISVSTIYHQA